MVTRIITWKYHFIFSVVSKNVKTGCDAIRMMTREKKKIKKNCGKWQESEVNGWIRRFQLTKLIMPYSLFSISQSSSSLFSIAFIRILIRFFFHRSFHFLYFHFVVLVMFYAVWGFPKYRVSFLWWRERIFVVPCEKIKKRNCVEKRENISFFLCCCWNHDPCLSCLHLEGERRRIYESQIETQKVLEWIHFFPFLFFYISFILYFQALPNLMALRTWKKGHSAFLIWFRIFITHSLRHYTF